MVVPVSRHILTSIEDLYNLLEQGARPNHTQQARARRREETQSVLRLDERKLTSWQNRTRALPNIELQSAHMDPSTDRKWKIGQGFMHIDNMYLAKLESVSKGSFTPQIWVVDPTA